MRWLKLWLTMLQQMAGAVTAGGVFPSLVGLFKSYFNEQFREVGVMQVVIEYAPVWHATDTLIGLRSARNALANRDLALRVITNL